MKQILSTATFVIGLILFLTQTTMTTKIIGIILIIIGILTDPWVIKH